jgi:hypothetical protein
MGNRTRDLRVCSLVPEPSTLPRASFAAVHKAITIEAVGIKFAEVTL